MTAALTQWKYSKGIQQPRGWALHSSNGTTSEYDLEKRLQLRRAKATTPPTAEVIVYLTQRVVRFCYNSYQGYDVGVGGTPSNLHIQRENERERENATRDFQVDYTFPVFTPREDGMRPSYSRVEFALLSGTKGVTEF